MIQAGWQPEAYSYLQNPTLLPSPQTFLQPGSFAAPSAPSAEQALIDSIWGNDTVSIKTVKPHETRSLNEPSDNDLHIDAYTDADKNLSWGQQQCLKMIAWYQRNYRKLDKDGNIEHKLGITCPCSPSCSSYTADVIRKFGVLKGIWMGAQHVLMCNPIYFRLKTGKWLHESGDIPIPVPNKFQWFPMFHKLKKETPEAA